MEHQYEGLQRLSETHDYKVAADDPDIRGWEVVTGTTEIGEVSDLIVDPSAMKVRFVEIELDRSAFDLNEGKRVTVPVSSVELDSTGRQVRLSGMGLTDIAGLPQYAASTARTANSATGTGYAAAAPDVRKDQTRLTRAEEELHVGTRKAEAGEVRVAKHVETEHVRQPVSVERERVHIERRPVEGAAVGRDITIGEDEIRVPVIEEEVVLEKRAVVKEELIISKDRVRESETVEADLRKERFDVSDEAHVLDRDSQSRRRTGER